jgi:hypothetical protein
MHVESGIPGAPAQQEEVRTLSKFDVDRLSQRHLELNMVRNCAPPIVPLATRPERCMRRQFDAAAATVRATSAMKQ